LVRANVESVLKFVAHSSRVLSVAARYGWLPAANYDNLRNVRMFERVGFIDINWKRYNFRRHLEALRVTSPLMTVARDVEDYRDMQRILDQARELARYCTHVVIVPKDPRLGTYLDTAIPGEFLLGYSVPTRYGGTPIPPRAFTRPVHLLGGRPDIQRRLADVMPVVSVDCNRFTLDAAYGDYFDGETFRPHPVGGYDRCIADSIQNINALWESYRREKASEHPAQR
jgi:hypothetical protein